MAWRAMTGLSIPRCSTANPLTHLVMSVTFLAKTLTSLAKILSLPRIPGIRLASRATQTANRVARPVIFVTGSASRVSGFAS
jgi:hypothetical protein